jgi:hypothetical protein
VFEEAGVVGTLNNNPFLCLRKNVCLNLYLMHVRKLFSKWSEEKRRTRKWVSISKASKIVNHKEIGKTLKNFKTE